MTLPPRYIDARSSIKLEEINLGSSGLHLYPLPAIEIGQLGYAVAQDGSSLCTGESGAWKPNWIVIGYDTGSGDPLIMDTSNPTLPIFRDFNGQGKWNPIQIAISLDAFLSSLKEFAKIAHGRSTPSQLEANPLTPDELNDFLSQIADLNHEQISMDFWKALLES